ncbi:Spy/CpxP family protein refolding chaperone [Rhodopseudomonas palustris]|uniref:LTXXQ motif family protein n=1 Tax=Rhodopseudomonas palustris (strain BisB18) TaxID=316056 RepID=Q213F3_RHOPB
MHSQTSTRRRGALRIVRSARPAVALLGAALLTLLTLLTLLAMPLPARAQGLVQGVQQGSREGNKAAGPVGGVLGGAIGGVVGVVGSVLGVPGNAPRQQPAQQGPAPAPDGQSPANAPAKGAAKPAKGAAKPAKGSKAAKQAAREAAKTAKPSQTVAAPLPVELTADQIVANSDANIARIKAELNLTPEQEKHWTAFNAAMHSLGNNGADRLRLRAERAKRDPPDDIVEQMRNEAQFLYDRAQDQRNVADAADPLFMSLDAKQKPIFIAEMVRLSRERGLD